MYNFLEEIGLRYSMAAKSQTREIMSNLNLFLPKNDEYLVGKEHLLVFLNPFGMVLRVGDALPAPEHDLILKPIKKVVLEKAVFEVLPGIECGISMHSRDLARLRQVFANEQYDFWDWDKTSNVGFLPAKASPFQGNIPVVLDRGAIRKADMTPGPRIKQFREAGEQVWRPVEFRGVQDRIFAPFKAAIEAAWPGNDAQIDSRKMLDFWKLCRAEIQKREQAGQGVLCNKWEDNNGGEEYFKTVQARTSSEVYGERYAHFRLSK